MRVHELLHERQSNAGTFMRAGLRALDAVKAPEQLRDFIAWDAHSAVLDSQLSRAIEPGQANGDATLEGVLERVQAHLPGWHRRSPDLARWRGSVDCRGQRSGHPKR